MTVFCCDYCVHGALWWTCVQFGVNSQAWYPLSLGLTLCRLLSHPSLEKVFTENMSGFTRFTDENCHELSKVTIFNCNKSSASSVRDLLSMGVYRRLFYPPYPHFPAVLNLKEISDYPSHSTGIKGLGLSQKYSVQCS